MIKLMSGTGMRKIHNTMNNPVKKMADGGFWDDLNASLSGTPKVAPVATTAQPIVALEGPNQQQGPLNINPYPEPKSPSASGTFNFGKATNTVSSITDSIAPFASNIVNGLRTPPQPHSPQLDNMVTLRAPSFDNDRAEVSREINSTNASVDRTVDGQTAAKIKLFNQGTKLEKLSSINQTDHNSQLQTSNDQARINSGIQSRNTERLNQYGDQQVERKIAGQREQSANLSNFSDKYVGIQNEKRKAQVDLDKTKTMATLFTKSGVVDRERKMLMDAGVPDPTGKNYEDIKVYGGKIKTMALGGNVVPRSFYKGVNPRSQTFRSLYKSAD